MRSSLALLACLPLALASCGGSSDPKALTDAGYEALARNETAEAQQEFESALSAIGDDEAHGQYMRAKTGWLEALATEDAAKAEKEFLALAKAKSLDAGQYSRIAGLLASSKNYFNALTVMHEGLKTYPDNEGLEAVLERLKAVAEDDDTLKGEMASLGYF